MTTKQLTYLSNTALLLEKYRDGSITKNEMTHLWTLVQKFVGKVADSHYKRKQGKGFRYEVGYSKQIYTDPIKYQVTNERAYEKHSTRVLMFLQFVQENKHRSCKWCMSTWRIRKAWVELLVEAKLYGVALYDDSVPITKQINKQTTRKLAEAKALIRKNKLRFTDFEGLRRVYSEKYPNKSEESVNKFLGVYFNYLASADPRYFEPRETKHTPKRDIETWKLRRIGTV